MKIFKVIRNIAAFSMLAIFVFNIASCSKSSPTTTTTTTLKSSARQVISITFNQFTPAVSAVVDNAGFWRIYTPIGSDLTHLTPTIVVSPKATVSPASGTVWDFTVNNTPTNSYNVVNFVVTAEDGESSTYNIEAF